MDGNMNMDLLTALAHVEKDGEKVLLIVEVLRRLEYGDLRKLFKVCYISEKLGKAVKTAREEFLVKIARAEYCFLKDLPDDFLIMEILRRLNYYELVPLFQASCLVKGLGIPVKTEMGEYCFLKYLPADLFIVEVSRRLGYGELVRLFKASCLVKGLGLPVKIALEERCFLEELPDDFLIKIFRIFGNDELKKLFKACWVSIKLRTAVLKAKGATP